MSYSGAIVPIPLGQLGLRTDDPVTSLPPNCLIKANNVSLFNNRIEKSRGSSKYNSTTLGNSVVCVKDWFPTPSLQRLIALTSNGNVYRDTGNGLFSGNVAIKTGLGTLTTNCMMVEGGSEAAGYNKKLFIFTDTAKVQIISGDASATTDIANPAVDWAAGNNPKAGIVYQGRMIAFGNANRRHTIYTSTSDDHEKFDDATNSFQFNIFPGEGDGLIAAAVYQGLLLVFKKPYGVFIVDGTQDPNPGGWSIRRYSDAFGVSSPNGTAQALGDLVGANSFGSVTSLQTTNAYGDLTAGDIYARNKVENYFRQELNPAGYSSTQALYYPEKKTLYFSNKSQGSNNVNRLVSVNFGQDTPRFTLETKDQPNCLALRRDSNGIERPMYGANDGFVYLMDQNVYNVGGNSAYIGEFQTPYIDFSFADQSLGGKSKLFDQLEVNYVQTGNWAFYIDVYIDNAFSETLTFSQFKGATIGSFILDQDSLGGIGTKRIRLPLHGSGRAISFRVYNGNLDQNFIIERLIVQFRPSGEQAIRT